MKIAIEGCCHGELDAIYATIGQLEKENNIKIDLLLICGDFQAVRNFSDFQAMAVPAKYQDICSFYKYYRKEKTAPVLTIIVGGNHEASNYMQELPYGGWVAPNIYYLGYAGVVSVGGVRIGGISGIFKGHDYNKGHYERPPYTPGSMRSAYHIRNLEVFRLKQISRPMDIFMSHDWPRGIYNYGNTAELIRKKPFFKQEVAENKIGCEPLTELLSHLKPAYWFAAHLHVKFAAHVQHQSNGTEPEQCTKFLALDKCLPGRDFLQILDVPHVESEGMKIKLDAEWLTILKETNHLLKTTQTNTFMPGPGCRERFDFTVEEKELKETMAIFGGDLTLPENFEQTAPPLVGMPNPRAPRQPLTVIVNPQTSLLCTMLELTDPNAAFLGKTSEQILNDSYQVGDAGDGDSGDDVVEDDDDVSDNDDEMPSCIDSSMDASNTSGLDSSALNSPGPPKFGEKAITTTMSSPRVEVKEDDEELQLILATQKKTSFNSSAAVATESEKVTDSSPSEEDELQAILAAQKAKSSKSSESDSGISKNSGGDNCGDSSIGCSDNISISSSSICDASLSKDSGDDRPVNSLNKSFNCSDSAKTENDEDELQAILAAQKSAKPNNTSPESSKSPSNDSSNFLSPLSSTADSVSSLNKNATSFGMSLLRLDSSGSGKSAPSTPEAEAGQKRRSPPLTSTPSNGSTPTNTDAPLSSGAKKLKRRNVSMYAENE